MTLWSIETVRRTTLLCGGLSMLLSRLADEFYDHILAERGGSENTVVAYRATINRLLEFLEAEGVEPDLDHITTAVLRRFIVHIKGTGIRGSTVARHIHGLKSFWRFIVETYDLQSDPTLPLRTPRVEHRIPDILSQKECERVIAACDQSHFSLYRVRDRAMVKLMMILGLRRGEVIRLQLSDYDRAARTLKIIDSKNRKSRLLPVPDGIARDLDAWLDARPDCEHDHLFCSRQASPLGPKAIYRMMDRLAATADLGGKHLHPHMLRHTAATMALRNSGDLLATQRLLGHSDPSVTRVYCHLIIDDVRRTVATNPLSSSGCKAGPGQSVDGSLGLSEDERLWLEEMDDLLAARVEEYDALLDASPELGERWRRYWIADWCRSAFAEGWPMTVEQAQRVIWSGEVVPGHSVPCHLRMCNLHRALEVSANLRGIPTDLASWMAEVDERLTSGIAGASANRPFPNSVEQLRPASEDVPILVRGLALACAIQGVDQSSPTIAVIAHMLLMRIASRTHALPIYPRPCQAGPGSGLVTVPDAGRAVLDGLGRAVDALVMLGA